MPPAKPVREIRTDLACRRCGYNLRGLAGDGSCPECGAAIEWSSKGWQLRHANPQWVAQLKRGGDALFLASLLFISLVAITGVLSMAERSTLLPFMLLLVSGLLTVQLRAVWLLTVPEPFIDPPTDPFSARRVARYGGGFLLTAALLMIVKIVLAAAGERWDWEDVMFDATDLIIVAAPPLSLFLLSQHLHAITARLPESYIDSGFKAFWFGVTVAVVLTAGLIFLAAGSFGALAFPLVCGVPLVVLTFVAWFTVLAAEFAGALAAAARAAQLDHVTPR